MFCNTTRGSDQLLGGGTRHLVEGDPGLPADGEDLLVPVLVHAEGVVGHRVDVAEAVAGLLLTREICYLVTIGTGCLLLGGTVVVGAGVVVVGSLQTGHSPGAGLCHTPPGRHIRPNMLSQVAPGR